MSSARNEMACDRCKRHHGVVWFAPSGVWNRVMRDGDRGNPDRYSFCCPLCFIQLAEEAGVKTAGWLVTPDPEKATYPRTPVDLLLSELDGIVAHSGQYDVREDLQYALAEARKGLAA